MNRCSKVLNNHSVWLLFVQSDRTVNVSTFPSEVNSYKDNRVFVLQVCMQSGVLRSDSGGQ